jgi:hypothetical protein
MRYRPGSASAAGRGLALSLWLDIRVEPEIQRIALIDGPSVLG